MLYAEFSVVWIDTVVGYQITYIHIYIYNTYDVFVRIAKGGR